MSDAADDPIGDPIALVCGVKAAEILARAHAAVGRIAPPSPVPATPAAPAAAIPDAAPALVVAAPRRADWRLLDLGDGTREQFIEAAHQAILGRAAAPPEVALRLLQFDHGRSRLGVLLRLALSEEGRAVAAPPIQGFGLRAIHNLAPSLVALARLPVLRAAQRTLRLRRGG